MKTPISMLLTILVASGAAAQERANQARPEIGQTVCSKAERVGDDKWRSFFMFSVSGHDYTIRGDGLAESAEGKSRPHNFRLRLEYKGHIEHVCFLDYEGDLLLIYEASDELNGWGYVTRLDQKAVKTKWVTPVNGFNVGPVLVEANYAYLTAASLIAKLDLQSGAYVWQLEDLEKKYLAPFEAFRPPWISGDRVFFKEDTEPANTIEVDKMTGKILKVRDQ